MQFLQKDKTRAAVPRVMQQEKGQLQGGLRYLGQLFKQLQVSHHQILLLLLLLLLLLPLPAAWHSVKA